MIVGRILNLASKYALEMLIYKSNITFAIIGNISPCAYVVEKAYTSDALGNNCDHFILKYVMSFVLAST